MLANVSIKCDTVGLLCVCGTISCSGMPHNHPEISKTFDIIMLSPSESVSIPR